MTELTKLLTDLSIISLLDDEPNDVGGLSAEEFKAKFDEAANTIKDYINETLLPELASDIGAQNIGIETIPGVTGATNVQAALTKIESQLVDMTQGAVADGSINAAKLADDAVTADKLANNAVTADKLADDAVETAALADNAVTHTNMAANSIGTAQIIDGAVTHEKLANAAIGTEQIDAVAVTAEKLGTGAVTAPKIANNAVSTVYVATLDTTWSGSAAPYSKAQTINGILETDEPIIDLVPSDTFDTAETQIEAWSCVYRATTSANTITFYATDKPGVDIPIKVRCIRK